MESVYYSAIFLIRYVGTFFLISVQKFSMGLRLGEFPGHLSSLTCCEGVFLAKAEVVFTSCHKAKQ